MFFSLCHGFLRALHSFPTRRSSDLTSATMRLRVGRPASTSRKGSRRKSACSRGPCAAGRRPTSRSEEHTSELQSLRHLVCRLLLEKKNKHRKTRRRHQRPRYTFAEC